MGKYNNQDVSLEICKYLDFWILDNFGYYHSTQLYFIVVNKKGKSTAFRKTDHIFFTWI